MKHLLIILALALSACSESDKCTASKSGDGPNRLIAFGDSQTAGHASESSKLCGYSYANILSQELNLRLFNQAIGGAVFTGLGGSNAIDKQIEQFEFRASDKVIMMIGFNDSGRYKSDADHLAKYKSALKEKLIYLSPLVKSIDISTNIYALDTIKADADLYRTATHEVVDALGLSNVRAFEVDSQFQGDASMFVEDRIHINLKAQVIVSEQFKLKGELQ